MGDFLTALENTVLAISVLAIVAFSAFSLYAIVH